MTAPARPSRLDSAETLKLHLRMLLKRDARLKAIAKLAGPFDVRLTEPGFSGLARVICGQQLSVASARAIWGRYALLPGATDAAGYLKLDEATVRSVGFSAGKYRTLRGVAEAVVGGTIDFAQLEAMSAEDAVAALTALKGIGPWTAEIYLMFCAGHPDIFPVGDLALQKAVGHALGMETTPIGKELAGIAADWAPHRHAAALLFWRYYASVIRKSGGTAL